MARRFHSLSEGGFKPLNPRPDRQNCLIAQLCSGKVRPSFQPGHLNCRLFSAQGPTVANEFHSIVQLKSGLFTMSKVCQVTGKGPVTGNNVSHSNIKTKRRFLPNLQSHRFWVESENRFVKLRVSTKGMRIIDKKGIDAVLTEMRARGEKV